MLGNDAYVALLSLAPSLLGSFAVQRHSSILTSRSRSDEAHMKKLRYSASLQATYCLLEEAYHSSTVHYACTSTTMSSEPRMLHKVYLPKYEAMQAVRLMN